MEKLILKLKKHNISVKLVEGDLAINVPHEGEFQSVLEEIQANKQKLISLMAQLDVQAGFQPIKPAMQRDYYPLSSAQKRQYFLYEFDRTSLAYNMPQVIGIRGDLKKDHLERVFALLAARHESLRTRIVLVDDEPYQQVVSEVGFSIKSLSGDVATAVEKFVRPFDLYQAPLFRVGLLPVEPGHHVLMLDMHHIISDGVSHNIFMRDFMALYRGESLPALTLQYKDFSVWQQGGSYQQTKIAQRSFWLSEFTGDLSVLDLPTDRPHNVAGDKLGGVYSLALSEQETRALRQLAESEGATMFMTVLALYYLLLAKLSNQSDLVIGTPVAGRNHADLEGIMGMFVNTLALRNFPKPEKTFRSFLREVKLRTIQCFDNQAYPYEDLVDELNLERNTGRNPLFDVMFSYDNFVDTTFSLPGLTLEACEGPPLVAKFDFGLSAAESEPAIYLQFDYARDLFDAATVERYAGYFRSIVSQVIAKPEVRLSDIVIISEAEKMQILREFNPLPTPRDPNANVVTLLEQAVQGYPANIAIRFREDEITFKEFNKKVNQLAHYLVSRQGIVREDRIGLYLERSPDLVIAMLAILKAGATYVPLDTEYAISRVEDIIEDAQITVVITNTQHARKVMALTTVVDLRRAASEIGSMRSDNPGARILGSQGAYVIYTSGSTGKPKGILIEHSSVVDYALTFQDYYTITSEDRIILQASPAFDTSVEEIFPALISGATLLVMPNGGRDIAYLVNAIQHHGATVLTSTPLVISELNAQADKLKTLRIILSGGDVLLPSHVDNLIKDHTLYNGYGPSESTVCATYNTIHRLEQTALLGKPIQNRKVIVTGPADNLCPVLVAGELCVGGLGLARGYVGNDELTSLKFVSSPWLDGARVYKTGDLVRWLPDGTIEFLGRIDNQVKIRGYRVELGDIESHLVSHEQISSATVVVKKIDNTQFLVAYYTARNPIDKDELRKYLAGRLVHYMIPSHFVRLESLPVMASGKPDKARLPEPDFFSTELVVAPANDTEHRLALLWAEVLHVEIVKVGVLSGFFELGGNSLRATVLVNKIAKVLRVSIPLKVIFQNANVRSLAAYIEAVQRNAFQAIQKADEAAYYPLSSAQKRQYFLYEFDRTSLAYNMPLMVSMKGTLNKTHLENVFSQLVARHESLRTQIVLVDGEPYQQIVPAIDFLIEDLAGELEAATECFVRPFDLGKAPLFRVGLFRISADHQTLMMDTHHIIGDGVSHSIFLRDFMALYKGETLPALALQYKDYAAWQQSSSYQASQSAQRNFWLSEFAKEATVLDLPADRPRPLVRSNSGEAFGFTLDREQTDALRNLSESEGTTMFMVGLTLYNILLSKLTNQSDIIVGTPVTGRSHADLEDMIGMFVNTLALRNYPQSKKTFRVFLSEVKASAIQCFDNQSYPYEELIDALNIRRNTGRNPLFDVMFAYDNIEPTRFELPGLMIESCESTSAISKLDMTLTVGEEPDGLHLNFEYSKDLFDRATIERFARYLQQIVSAVVNEPSIAIGDIEILTGAEKEQLLAKHRGEILEYPEVNHVLECFDAQARRTPGNMALLQDGCNMTYRELQCLSDQIAAHLHFDLGVKKGDLVGLILGREEHLIPMVYGVLKCGAAYVPIGVHFPVDRITAIVEDAKLQYIITRYQTHSLILSDPIKTIDIDALVATATAKPLRAFDAGITGNDLAYVLFTSGSTGRPKGVMIEHGSLVNLVHSMDRYYPLLERDRHLLKTTYTFDVSVSEIFGWFLSGGSLFVLPTGAESDPAWLFRIIEDKQITHVTFVPAMLSAFLDQLRREDVSRLDCVKYMLVGGEALASEVVRQFHSLGLRCQLDNMYGPTETTINSSNYATRHFKEGNGVPIGKPMFNVDYYVLDSRGHLQPEGVAGELCIGGVQVGRGYLNNEKLTSEKFRPDPFKPGSRMYRSGDLARWLPDGNIEYLGRMDNQVKIRGFRIELGEIENRLMQHPHVSAAAAAVKEKGGEKYLVGYYVANIELTEADLKAYLSTCLTEYMVPGNYVRMDRLPMLPNGKVNRKALPDPDDGKVASATEPASALERRLTTIWAEVLKIDVATISVTRSFFEMGGNSLRATVLANKIQKELQVSVPLKVIFQNANIRALCEYIGTLQGSIYEAVPAAPAAPYYPLSSSQKRQYFLYEFDRTSLAYNMPQIVSVKGPLDTVLLEKVFTRLIARHESLRTQMILVDGEPYQQVLRDVPFTIEMLTGDADIAAEGFVRPFDLYKAPLIRVGLLPLAPDDHVLMIDQHHIISDGVSNGIFMREFMSLYRGASLAKLTLQYKDYAVWQQSPAYQATKKSQRDFWLSEFATEASMLELPADLTRPLVRTNQGDGYAFELNTAQSKALRALADAEGATMFMVGLALYNVLLSKLSHQSDIVIGTPVAGRNHADLDNIMGMFVNTLALRNYPRTDKTFRTFVAEVKTRTIQCFENQAYPYEELIDELKIERNTGRNPLFDVMFAFDNFDQSGFALPGLKFESNNSPVTIAKFDLSLSAIEGDNVVRFHFEYAKDLFDHTTIERYGGYLRNIIDQVTRQADIMLSDIVVMPEHEKQLQLNVFNPKPVLRDKESNVVQLFEKAAEAHCRNIALRFRDEEITYDELQVKVNNLAHYLLGKGVRGNDRVGLYFDRSPEMIVAMMAILKAGATYVPLDPEYTTYRITEIIHNAHIKAVVTHNRYGEKIEDLHIVIDVHAAAGDIDVMSSYNPERKIQANEPAYIIYTSGSTGRPKGILIRHASLLDYALTFQQHFFVTASDRVIQQASPTFDTSIEEIFPALISGATLLIMPDGGRDIAYLAHVIEKERATILSTTPLVLAELNAFAGKFKHLRAIISGGEVLMPAHIDQLLKHHKVFNTYGPSESTVCATYHHIESLEQASLLGKPITNRTIIIADQEGNLCPILVPGELCIGGAGLAIGYLGNDALTAEKFMSNPLVNGNRVYRTGDMGRWLSDGTLEFLGRVDNQVKIRGYRVELGEVEAQMVNHEGIANAAVVVKRRDDMPFLVAYYAGAQAIDKEELREFLSGRLPHYMIPLQFIHLDRLPVTSSGKIDRAQLPEPDMRSMGVIDAPDNDVEWKLAVLWSEVLHIGIDQVGATSGFFELGGHSLRAIQLSAKIQDSFGVKIPLVDIFRFDTIRQQAHKVLALEISSPHHDQIVLLKKGADQSENFFFVHDGSGDIQGYLKLANQLKAYTCWGLRSELLSTLGPVDISLDDMAHRYIQSIRSVQPTGPYKLLGWSHGGIIAHEMARQLELANEEVALLVMIDSELVPASSRPFEWHEETQLLEQLLPTHVVRSVVTQSPSELWQTLLPALEQLGSAAIGSMIPDTVKRLIPHVNDLRVSKLAAYFNAIRSIDRAVSTRQDVRKVRAPLIYCKAKASFALSASVLQRYGTPASYLEIDGDHYSVMDLPHVKSLGRAINHAFNPAAADVNG